MIAGEQGYKMHSAELGHCRVAYIDEGTGEQTIIFIHGLANYAGVWKKNIDQLKQQHRCIAIDLPGNGYSDPGDHAYGMGFFADVVYQLIMKLKLGSVCVAGHSMGGQIAMTLALKYPEVVSKLVLCAPAGFEEFSSFERSVYRNTIHLFDMFSSEENSLRKTLQISFYLLPEEARPMIEELVALQRRYPAKKYRAMVEACIDSMLEEPVVDRLHEIKQPTLIIYGERDALIPNKMIHPVSTKHLAEKAAAKFPNAELHMIAKCGHFVHWEDAGDVNYYIKRFV
jgi:pimeloyl-ACP methyl ester carboxylesterase